MDRATDFETITRDQPVLHHSWDWRVHYWDIVIPKVTKAISQDTGRFQRFW